MVVSNKGIVSKVIPTGCPVIGEHLEVIDRTIDIENFQLGKNELLLKNVYISYMRKRMREPHIKSCVIDAKIISSFVRDHEIVITQAILTLDNTRLFSSLCSPWITLVRRRLHFSMGRIRILHNL